MRYLITVEPEDEFDKEAVVHAVKNKLKLEGIYSQIFRPVIKYSENTKEVKAFKLVWKKLGEYLNEK